MFIAVALEIYIFIYIYIKYELVSLCNSFFYFVLIVDDLKNRNDTKFQI